MHRFFVPPNAIDGAETVLPADVAFQVCNVLRMRPGERIVVLDNSGWEFEVELIQAGREKAVGKVLDKRRATGEPGVRITLYQSLLKRDSLEWILQKCTEVGVVEFVPMISRRAIASAPGGIRDSKRRRWERIIAEATEQSHRGRLPALREPLKFEEAVSGLARFDLALMPWEQEQELGTHAALANAGVEKGRPVSIALLIGPEGGFAEEETALAKAHGALAITLGPRILRAETAALVAATLILHEFGELGH